MKKFTVLFIVLLLTISCKKSKESSPVQKLVGTPSCITLEAYDRLTSTPEKAEWLRERGSLVCDSILLEAETIHHIADTTVSIITGQKPFIITQKSLDSLMGTYVYEKYVGFEMDPDNNVSNVVLIPLYDERVSCYSIPMFRSITAAYHLTGTSEFEFLLAIIATEEKVVVRIKDDKGHYVYYDNTTSPL